MNANASVFTNPISRSVEGAGAYREAILALVGDADPLPLLAAAAARLREALDGVAAARLQRPEAPGKWSAGGVVRHLADSEVVHGWRLRLVLGQDRPPLTGYDQDGWAERLRYDDVDLPLALAVFDVNRAANLELYGRLGPAEWRREGLHVERGPESVAIIARLYAGHDIVHLRQLRRILAAVTEEGA
jgi:hypothetical protein